MPKEKGEEKAIRAITCSNPYKGFQHVVFALAFECKNLYNTCVFLINQVNTAYVFDTETKKHKLKDKLHPNQEMAIAEYNAVIDSVNATRQAKTDEENLRNV